VTAAAQVGTLPIVAVGFHLVSISGLVANALVLPLLPLLIALGFLLGVLSPIAAAASPLSALAYALLHVVVVVSERLAELPGSLGVDVVAAPFTLIYYSALAAGALLLLRTAWAAGERRPFGAGRELLLSLTVGAVVLTMTPLSAADASQPRLQWLGSGNALLLRSDRQIVLIDGSPRPFGLLERLGRVLPYSTHSIDLVIVTDPRSANVAGLDAILTHYSIGEVLDVGSQYPSTTYARWRGHLREKGIPAYALRTGARVHLPDVTITALGPDAVTSRPQDSAGLLRISMHGRSLILAGAASRREQRESLFRGVALRGDALLADGTVGLDPDFRRAVRPRVVLVAHSGHVSHAVPLPKGRIVPITFPSH
jgi:beta-lactamase superfamily II metal-dependent hydrolase